MQFITWQCDMDSRRCPPDPFVDQGIVGSTGVYFGEDLSGTRCLIARGCRTERLQSSYSKCVATQHKGSQVGNMKW